MIAILTFQCFQIPLAPRIFPIWNFLVELLARKTMLNLILMLKLELTYLGSEASKYKSIDSSGDNRQCEFIIYAKL